jgi:TRAP-type C4-dicarboxylate transport system permease small subunit
MKNNVFRVLFLLVFASGFSFYAKPAYAYLFPLLALGGLTGPILAVILSVFLIILFHVKQVIDYFRGKKTEKDKNEPENKADETTSE